MSVWPGTDEERLKLMAAIERHCTCERGLAGAWLTTCGSHQILLEEDQRAILGLLFVRRNKAIYVGAEFRETSTGEA